MRKKQRLRRTTAGISALVMGTSMILSGTSPVLAGIDETKASSITADPDIHHQTLEGWGTSLCWWGNVIGSWGDADWNGDGRPDREEIAELAFHRNI